MRASIPFVPLSRRAAVLMLVLFLTAVAYAQITPSDDAYVNSAAPTTNYGTAATLIVNSAADTGFIRFDLTAVPSTYTGSQVKANEAGVGRAVHNQSGGGAIV